MTQKKTTIHVRSSFTVVSETYLFMILKFGDLENPNSVILANVQAI